MRGLVLLGLALAAAACASPTSGGGAAGCADVVGVEASAAADGSYTFSVTVRSPDTGWDKYADLWEVRAPDGTVLGEWVLAHPHVDEQPFTRSLAGVQVPDGLSRVVVAARDSVEGFCGETMTVELG